MKYYFSSVYTYSKYFLAFIGKKIISMRWSPFLQSKNDTPELKSYINSVLSFFSKAYWDIGQKDVYNLVLKLKRTHLNVLLMLSALILLPTL